MAWRTHAHARLVVLAGEVLAASDRLFNVPVATLCDSYEVELARVSAKRRRETVKATRG